MASDNFPNLGTGAQQIKQWIEQIGRRLIADYARSHPLQIDPQGNITIPNGCSLTVTGALIVNGTATINGTATMNGNLQSGNYVSGSSGYQLSGSQISTYTSIAGFGNGQAVQVSVTNFGLSTTLTQLGSSTLTVPQGYTKLVASASAQVFSYNQNTTGGSNGAGGDAIYTSARLSTAGQSDVYTTPTPLGLSGSGGYTTTNSEGALQLTGLTAGQTITYSVWGRSAYQSLAVNSANTGIASFAMFWLP